MKPILFLGCSFTWGQGLWFYGDFEFTENQKTNSFMYKNFSQNLIDYKNIYRFPRLVSEHFNTDEIVKYFNGGTNTESLNILQKIISGGEEHIHEIPDLIYTDFSKISHIILQFTQEHRGFVVFEEGGVQYVINLLHICDKKLPDNYYEESLKSFSYINLFDNIRHARPNHYEQIHELVKGKNLLVEIIEQELHFINYKIIPSLNEIGIPISFISWPNTYPDMIFKKYPEIESRFIKLRYKNNEYTNIYDLIEKNGEMELTGCPEISHLNVEDDHPSKKCHRVIADSIISHIEEYENNISNG